MHAVSKERIVQTQNFVFGRFSNFFFIQMRPGPTHPLPIFFWIFGIFLTLQSPLETTADAVGETSDQVNDRNEGQP